MIPLVVCTAYSQQDFVAGFGIAVGSVFVGWIASKPARTFWFWMSCVVALFVACAALCGFWPFDPRWKDDCGVTPDPAELTIGAAVISPLLLGAAYFVSTRLKRLHR